ncbi:hypothetical protein C483_15996 [Natrialba hulunbeirensis JCM 10989]|uniref:Uncharacterized protein n=1 Tax=Natrialba hulunbeirensis JCM 10989 TaxID=1227493 RepID=L9ZNZ4_9EURY|nr:hypothetical protein C483_15996 [Natrialba hulunbeirensis JCM 10989]
MGPPTLEVTLIGLDSSTNWTTPSLEPVRQIGSGGGIGGRSGGSVFARSGLADGGDGFRWSVFVVGCCLILLGVVGVRYAPAIVRAQAREGMTPVEDEHLEETDRIRVTKGTSVVFLVVGVVLVGYASGVV